MAIAALARPAGLSDGAAAVKARLERLVIVGDRVVVAELDGQSSGLAHLHVSPTIEHERPAAKLGALVVDESHRGQGIGRALVEAVGGGSAPARVRACSSSRPRSGATTRTGSTSSLGLEQTGRRYGADAEPVVDPLLARRADALVDALRAQRCPCAVCQRELGGTVLPAFVDAGVDQRVGDAGAAGLRGRRRGRA